MQLSKNYVSLIASQALITLLVVYAAWQFFDNSARFYLIGVPILYQLVMVLKGYDFWRKGQNVFAWWFTVFMPLVMLMTIYFTLQIVR